MSLIWSWWHAAVDWLMGAAAALFWLFVGKWLVCSLGKWFCWLVLLFIKFTLPVLLFMLEQLRVMPTLVLSPILTSWRIVNYFFPLNETLGVIGMCVVFVLAWRAFRFLKQFIPGSSN